MASPCHHDFPRSVAEPSAPGNSQLPVREREERGHLSLIREISGSLPCLAEQPDSTPSIPMPSTPDFQSSARRPHTSRVLRDFLPSLCAIFAWQDCHCLSVLVGAGQWARPVMHRGITRPSYIPLTSCDPHTVSGHNPAAFFQGFYHRFPGFLPRSFFVPRLPFGII